ncbi:hypothetical protein HCN44_007409 [Aphidius gifuensis]|uniref:Thioredoxin domain-containing protein 17 n=1 Tax=Aphidius gifuensis TaxID=684658 RepID=A0A835CLS1_APHGI|nr:thioredoxin domain-containing protein 17-like [Aphidius gifuensis]KAF7989099.1 hypothetical protein HCN44_007409 [Aphidius gifuensis]
MVIKHHVTGYDKFLEFMEKLKVDEPIFVLYSGTKLDNGKSWCPDCVEAEPFIEEAVNTAPENSHFIHVEVGDRPFWKDLKCPFRINPKTKLSSLPTISRWGTQKKLEGEHLLDVELIKMLLHDDDD